MEGGQFPHWVPVVRAAEQFPHLVARSISIRLLLLR